MDRAARPPSDSSARPVRSLPDPVHVRTGRADGAGRDLTGELAEVARLTSDIACCFLLDGRGRFEIEWITEGREAPGTWDFEALAESGGWHRLVHPDDRERVSAWLVQLAAERCAEPAEMRLVPADGVVRWMRVAVRHVEDAPDGRARFHAAAQDVTDRKLAELELAEREAQLAEAQAVAHLGSWTVDTASGTGRWSDEMYRIHGLEAGGPAPNLREHLQLVHADDRDAAAGEHLHARPELTRSEEVHRLAGVDPRTSVPTHEGLLALIHPDDRDGYAAAVRLALRSGEPFEHEYRIVRPDGEVRWVHNWAQPVRDASGEVAALEGVSQDVTALKTAQERYRLVSELTSDVAYSYHIDAEGRVVVEWMTGGMEEVTGYTSEEALALGGWLGMLPEDEVPRYAERLQRIFEGRQVDAEFRIRAKSGRIRWVWISARPEIDVRTGEVARVYGAARDITERKRAEEALAESEARLREAHAIGHVGSWEWDVGADRMTWSEEVRAFLGVTDERAPTDLASFLEFVHAGDREAVRATVDHMCRVGGEIDGDFRLLPAGGGVRWILARGSVRYDAAGRIVALLGTFQDVTERREEEERYRAISEMISDAAYAFRLDDDGVARPEWITSSFQRLTGYLDEEAMELLDRWRDYVHPDDHDTIVSSVKHALAGHEDVCEYRLTTASGEQRWIQARARPVVEDGRITRIYGAAQDVTEQRLAERALRRAYERERDAAARLRAADRLKDEFLATASHELRTPLTSIVGFASALSRQGRDLDPDTRDQLVRKLERNALELGEMVERLLDFSRLQAGTVEIRREPLVLSDVVEQCLESHVAASVMEHRVDVDVPEDVEISGDRAAVIHVLANLVTNAAKYSPAGSTIRITAHRADDDLVVAVHDQGIGIDREHQRRIFDRFFRGPQQPTGTRGSGIGLAIARTSVDLMDGRLWVDSSPGAGSTFSFSLPLASTSRASVSR